MNDTENLKKKHLSLTTDKEGLTGILKTRCKITITPQIRTNSQTKNNSEKQNHDFIFSFARPYKKNIWLDILSPISRLNKCLSKACHFTNFIPRQQHYNVHSHIIKTFNVQADVFNVQCAVCTKHVYMFICCVQKASLDSERSPQKYLLRLQSTLQSIKHIGKEGV